MKKIKPMNDQNQNDSMSPGNISTLRTKWYSNRKWLFIVFNVLFVLAFFGPLINLALFSLNGDYDTYIPFIPFISAYVMHLSRKLIFLEKESFSVVGLLIVLIGILSLYVDRTIEFQLNSRDYLAFIIFLLVMTWIGGFIMIFGMRSFRAAAFPLLFLFFMTPIPSAPLERIISFLQAGSTEIAYGFLSIVGVPAARDGFVFHLPTLDVEVAKQCSGIRSSLALVITGVLAGYFFLRRGWTRSLLLISIVPIAVLKNGFRIAVLTTLGVYVDKRILSSDLHRKGGFVFFIFAIMLLWWVIVSLRKAEEKFARNDKSHALE
jgi:exosortase